MSAQSPSIGVVGSDDIAAALRRFGFNIVTGEGTRAAATAISNAFKDSPFPVVYADSPEPTYKSWAKVTSGKATRFVVVETIDGAGALDSTDHRLDLPATFNDLLGRLGYQSTTHEIGAMHIQFDTTLGEEPAERPATEPVPEPEPEAEIPLPDPVDQSTVPESAAAAEDVDESMFANVAVQSAASEQPEPASAPLSFLDEPVQSAPAVAPETPQTEDPVSQPATVAEPAREPAPTAGGALSFLDEPVQTPAGAPRPEPHPQVDVEDAPIAAAAPVTTPEPEPEPVQEAPQPAATAGAPSVDDYMANRFADADQQARARPLSGLRRGEVIVVGAGKGGVGKSTTSIMLAQAAAESGIRTILIDANRGQADLRKYLRLMNADLPTAYAAYEQKDPAAAVIKPEEFAKIRQEARLDDLDFGLVLGPPSDLADPKYVSARIYSDIIEHARSIADLVVIDTQILEAARTDLWEKTFVPLLQGDVWFVAITDESSAGVSNLSERLEELQAVHTPMARTLILASKYLEFGDEDVAYFQKRFADLGTLVGHTGIDDDFHMQINLGRILSDSPSIRPAIDVILLRVTGLRELFAPAPPEPQKTRGLFGGMFGGKKNKK